MKIMLKDIHQGALILLGLAALLTGCNDSGPPAGATADNTMIRIEINGQKFNVPVRYTYKLTKEKWGSFRTPKKERVSVDYLSIDVLMPDLRPYHEEEDARWNVKGHGDRVMITLRQRVGDAGWYEWLTNYSREQAESGRYIKEHDIYGLVRYDEGPNTRHFPSNGTHMTITCDKSKPGLFPSCRTKSEYRGEIVLEYYYGLDYLPKWNEIDDGLKAMFDRFAENAREHQGNAEPQR